MNRGPQPAGRAPRPDPTTGGPPPRVALGARHARARELVGGTVGLLVAGASLALLVSLARVGPGGQAVSRPDEVLLLALAWVGVALAAWLGLGSLLAVAALLPGAAGRVATEIARQVTPVAVRRTLTLVLGASVGSVVLPPAPVSSAGSVVPTVSAPTAGGRRPDLPAPPALPARPSLHAPTDPPVGPGYVPTPGPPGLTGDGTTADPSDPSNLGPGFVPTPPPPVHDADRSRLLAPLPRVAAATHDLVTVRRGDSLWSVAARQLGAGASDAQIAHEWPRWYAANRAVVGDDPDLLLPGQQLRPPAARR